MRENLRSQIVEAINVWTVTLFFILYFTSLYVVFQFGLLGERSESPPSPPNNTATTSTSNSMIIIQFTLEHAFGDSNFSDAGNVSAHLINWSDGAQFAIHTEGFNILAVNYGAPRVCPYPRQLKLPAKWTFKSHMLLKNTEHAPMTPIYTEEDVPGGEGITYASGLMFEYWMYLIPLGLIVMNVVMQVVNRPKEKTVWQALAHPKAETALVRKLLSMRNDYLLTLMKNDILEISD